MCTCFIHSFNTPSATFVSGSVSRRFVFLHLVGQLSSKPIHPSHPFNPALLPPVLCLRSFSFACNVIYLSIYLSAVPPPIFHAHTFLFSDFWCGCDFSIPFFLICFGVVVYPDLFFFWLYMTDTFFMSFFSQLTLGLVVLADLGSVVLFLLLFFLPSFKSCYISRNVTVL